MLDVRHTCLNIGTCGHVWVAFGKEVMGYGHAPDHTCPRCDPKAIWVWKGIVGGNPKTRLK